jgi:hypothetical protein
LGVQGLFSQLVPLAPGKQRHVVPEQKPFIEQVLSGGHCASTLAAIVKADRTTNKANDA